MDPSIRQQLAWSPGQRILNDTGAREPEHTLDPPVPVTARIVWEDDGEEYIDTEAAGWGGQLVYVRMPDRRYRLTSVWLDAVDVGALKAGSLRAGSSPVPETGLLGSTTCRSRPGLR